MSKSTGCVSSLLAGLTSTNRLAGILGLSGYIPLSEELPTVRTRKTRHGSAC